MRIRSRVEAARIHPQPEFIASLHLVVCQRCLGHGYFQIHPPQMTPVMVSFSQEGAFNYLNRLVANRLISLNQYAVVEREIITSCLPIELPPDIRQLVGECVAWEEKVVEFASIDQEEAARFTLLGTDIAEAVHEYLLKSSGHLWLRMH